MRGSAVFRTGVAPGGALAPGWVKNELWRKARTVPSLDLRFADDKSLVDATTGASLVTFTRASSGTFVGSDGVLRTAVTNIIWPSEDFTTTWGISAATRVADAGIAPNGTLTADRIASTGGGVFRSGVSVASGISCTYSIYIKHVSGTGVISTIGFERFGAVPLAGQTSFNVLTGTVVSNGAAVTASSITPVGDGWYRVSVRATSTDTTTTITNYAAASGNQFLLWGAQLEQSATVGEYIPTTSVINSAPRFDHNPTTGESLGLLVEEQRTNSIRNNTGVGAVAGTPGTLPTNWTVGAAQGLTTDVAGVGTSAGVNYVDLRISGTPTGSPYIFSFESIGIAAAAASQTWTESFWLARIAGSETNIGGIQLRMRTYTFGNIFIAQADSANLTITSALARQTHNYASLPATTASIEPAFRILLTAGAAIDITLRIGLPQLEQGAFVTSVIPTTTAAATRSADVASIGSSAFTPFYNQSEGTMFVDFLRAYSGNFPNFPNLYQFNDGTNDNEITVFGIQGGQLFQPSVVIGASSQVNFVTVASIFPGPNRCAHSLSLNNSVFAGNGVLTTPDTSVNLPTVNQVKFGDRGGQRFTGHYKRICFWRQALPGATLQAITG